MLSRSGRVAYGEAAEKIAWNWMYLRSGSGVMDPGEDTRAAAALQAVAPAISALAEVLIFKLSEAPVGTLDCHDALA